MVPFVPMLYDKFLKVKLPKADKSAPKYGQPGSDVYAFGCAYRYVDLLWKGYAASLDDIADFLIGAHAHCDANGDLDGINQIEALLRLRSQLPKPAFIRSFISESFMWNFRDRRLQHPTWTTLHLLAAGPDRAFAWAMMILFHTMLLVAPWRRAGFYHVDIDTGTIGDHIDFSPIRSDQLAHAGRSRNDYGPYWLFSHAGLSVPTLNDPMPDATRPFFGCVGSLTTKPITKKYHAWSFSPSTDPLDHLKTMQIPYRPGRGSPDPMADENWRVLEEGAADYPFEHILTATPERDRGPEEAVLRAVANERPWLLQFDYGVWAVLQYVHTVPTWADPPF